ncbi:MAG: hypothetical protein ABS49_10285 [Erythrobacter sp. SCN 62-14]|nr:MAG: hypothetical protein ABS49_10285 [Erythrobacter sp. SCN 62-14]
MMEHASSQIGFLHPGKMGAALARIVKDNGHEAWWLADKRSPATAERAAAARFDELRFCLLLLALIRASACPQYSCSHGAPSHKVPLTKWYS